MKTSIIVPLALTLAKLALSLTASACSIRNGEITFYGYPDHVPPGDQIAYNCGREFAGGTGTHADPLTFASAEGEFDKCEVIYLPYLKKYLRYEDYCQECTYEWKDAKMYHIEVWIGNGTGCKNSLTPDTYEEILRQPSSNLPVNCE